MEILKIIFLDIDGVLVTFETIKESKKSGILHPQSFSSKGVELLNNLVSETNSKIVISSSWRRIHSLDFIREHFKKQGFLFSDRIIGVTPKIGDRGIEILQWLEDNKNLILNYDGYSYIVIDDDTQDILPYIQKENFIKTSMNGGFQEEHLKSALNVPFFGTKF